MDELWPLIDKGGVLAVLLLIILAGVQEWWVTGRQMQRERAENRRREAELRAVAKDWEHRFFQAMGMTERSIVTTARTVEKIEATPGLPLSEADAETLIDMLRQIRGNS